MIRLFGLYLMTENELMELDEKWLAMLPDIQNNRQGGFIAHEAVHWGRRKNVRVEVLYIPGRQP